MPGDMSSSEWFSSRCRGGAGKEGRTGLAEVQYQGKAGLGGKTKAAAGKEEGGAGGRKWGGEGGGKRTVLVAP